MAEETVFVPPLESSTPSNSNDLSLVDPTPATDWGLISDARRRLADLLAGEAPSPADRAAFARQVRTTIINAYLEADPRLRACARLLRDDATADSACADLLDLLIPDAEPEASGDDIDPIAAWLRASGHATH